MANPFVNKLQFFANFFNRLAKEGTKAVQLSYEDRNMMNVLNKQVHYCKFDEEKSKVGFLDLIGKDRLLVIFEN